MTAARVWAIFLVLALTTSCLTAALATTNTSTCASIPAVLRCFVSGSGRVREPVHRTRGAGRSRDGRHGGGRDVAGAAGAGPGDTFIRARRGVGRREAAHEPDGGAGGLVP